MTSRSRERRSPRAAAVMMALALAGAPALEPIQVTPIVADGRVSASFDSSPSFDADAADIVKSGLLLTFTFTLDLRRPSTVWMDRTLATATVASTVKYDNLTTVYQVSKLEGGRVSWSERTQDLAQVKAWMTRFDRFALASREPLEANAEYYVRVRMQASPRRNFSYWPWTGDAAMGRADFTFIR
jgi:hypothetical protein